MVTDHAEVSQWKGNRVMTLLSLITQLLSAFREFVAPRYRPELHYMHGPDGVFHWCSVAGVSDGHTICLFVPPRGF